MDKINANKKIVYVLFNHFEKDFLCDYVWQTAKILSNKNTVIIAYHSRPHSIGYAIKNIKRILEIISEWKKIIFSNEKGIYECEFISLIPFQRVSAISKFNRQLVRLELSIIFTLKKIFSGGGFKLVLWIFHPTEELFVKKMKEEISLYDVVDYFRAWKEDEYGSHELDKKLIQKIDLIFANSTALAFAINANKRNIIEVPCGCAVNEFPLNFYPKAKVIEKIKKPIVGFFGNIDFRIDYKLLEYLVSKNKNTPFLFIGKVWTMPFEKNKNINKRVSCHLENLKKYPNFHLLSDVSKEELKNYLYFFKAALVPYDINYEFVYYSNPMKFYEYLAMGVPVVSTPIPSLLKYEMPVVRFGKTHEEFDKHIKYLIKHPELAIKYKRQMRKIAKDNSWEKKVEEIEKHINEKILNSNFKKY